MATKKKPKQATKRTPAAKQPPTAAPRNDTPVTVRLNPAELRNAQEGLKRISDESGITLSFGAYVKHATLSYRRFRMMETAMRSLRKTLADDLRDLSAAPEGLMLVTMVSSIIGSLDSILAERVVTGGITPAQAAVDDLARTELEAGKAIEGVS